MNRLLKVTKYTVLFFIAFTLFVIFVDIFYPIDTSKAKDCSRVVLDRSNKWLYTTTNSTDKWRFNANIDKIDPLYIKMLLNFEDKRFYNHYGVDPLALARATAQFIKYRKITSGGSTITMQVAKLLEPKKRTLAAKIIEIIRSLELEYHYTKAEILQIYLTLAPYGGNIEGIEAASWRLFKKHPSSLSAAEAALLVALPKNPEGYRPDKHPKRAKKARDRVLKRAFEAGIISKFIYTQAIKEPINKQLYYFPRLAPHLSQKLLKKIKSNIIETTIDKSLQKQLEIWTKIRAKELPKGASIALLLVDNGSFEVRAYLGSNDMFSKKIPGYIDMVKVIRSPGSALKPFIYVMGFEKHIIHPQTIILDNEVVFGNYHPHNYSKRFHGEVTVAYALQNSLNIPAVKVLYRIGAGDFVDRLKASAGKIYIPKGVATLPVALGGLGISLWQMSQLYAILASGGEGKEIKVLKSSKQKSIKLFDQNSATLTTAILRDIKPPKGYIDKASKIAYKTGTSYGYRDFWAMGYSKNYTLGVWIGKANNQPLIKASAREVAVPIMFEAFSLIGAIKPIKGWDSSVNIYKNSPPKVLAYFDKEIENNKKLKFLYPKDGTKFQSAGCYKTTIKVAIENGTPPYYWYIDTKPIDIEGKKAQLKLDEGGHKIVILDSSGGSISSNIWINMPDCKRDKPKN